MQVTSHRQSYEDHSKPEVDQDTMEPEYMDSSGDSSDDSTYSHADRPIMQSAMRRKHHRAWSLSEVKKLVEGVSQYGVGKWSVIKKLTFSSHSYRTPVDLKVTSIEPFNSVFLMFFFLTTSVSFDRTNGEIYSEQAFLGIL